MAWNEVVKYHRTHVAYLKTVSSSPSDLETIFFSRQRVLRNSVERQTDTGGCTSQGRNTLYSIREQLCEEYRIQTEFNQKPMTLQKAPHHSSF